MAVQQENSPRHVVEKEERIGKQTECMRFCLSSNRTTTLKTGLTMLMVYYIIPLKFFKIINNHWRFKSH